MLFLTRFSSHARTFPFLAFALFVSVVSDKLPVRAAEADTLFVYVGTYTRGDSEGIYVCRLDLSKGQLSDLQLAASSENPSFVELHPKGDYLYAVNELGSFAGQSGTGGVSAFRRDPQTGRLELLNQQPSHGGSPCHLVVDREGKNVLVANYGGGSVVVLPIDEQGRLEPATSLVQHEGSSINPQRQKGPHAHSVNLDAVNRFAFVADLGLDQVLIYRFHSAKGSLAPHDPPFATVEPGSGPRHFAMHPSGRHAYVINELTSTVTAFDYDAEKGRLKSIQTITTLPADFTGNNSTAEIRIHPSGRFLYGSNRGHDSIAIFAIHEKTGALTAIGHQSTGGRTPRNFNVDPTGAFLLAANQASDNVVVFRVDRESGKLVETGQITVPTPVCLRFARVRS